MSVGPTLKLSASHPICPRPHPAPHSILAGTDVAIVRGAFGVVENGAVWIPRAFRHKAMLFIPEALVILLDRKQIVSNMHEAYARKDFDTYDFGSFIAGPSKTADIEQALVIGAHGARDVTVILM